MFVAVSRSRRQLLARRAALHALGASFAWLALAGTASAQPLEMLELHVTRSSGASDCPEAEELRALLAAARAKSGDDHIRLEVHFDRTSGGYAAVVRASGARAGVRALSVAETRCAPLVDVLLVSILVLLDPDAAAVVEPSPNIGSESTVPPAPAREAVKAPPPRRATPHAPALTAHARVTLERPAAAGSAQARFALGLGPTLALGLTPNLTPGTELGLTVRRGSIAGSFNISAFLPSDTRFGAGRVSAWLAAARLSVCWRWPAAPELELGTCLNALAARLSVSAAGYSANPGAVRPLWALGPESVLSGELGAAWGWLARGAVLVAPARESFSIAGPEGGEVFRVAVVNGWLGAGLWITIQ